MNARQKRVLEGRIIRYLAILVDVLPPFLATAFQFPLWISESKEAQMSALFLMFAFMSCIPFLKQIKMWLKSPSVWGMWIVIFVLMVALENIISEMVVIAFTGMISNIIGACIYKFGMELQTSAQNLAVDVNIKSS